MCSRPIDPADEFELAELWRSLIEGRLFIVETTLRDGRCVVRLGSRPRTADPIRARDASLLERVLCGEPQKVVADCARVNPSTLSMRCSKVLRSIGAHMPVSRASVALVIAAHSARGFPFPKARIESTAAHETVVTLDFPENVGTWPVSVGEAAVLRMTVEGLSHREIAVARGTSRRTVANQLAAIFKKLRISGRAELKAWAVKEHSQAWQLTQGERPNASPNLGTETTLVIPSQRRLPVEPVNPLTL